MQWMIQPSDDELQYLVIPSYYPLKIPPVGGRRMAGPERFRVLRRVPGGGWTITPELVVPRDGGVLRWPTPQRSADDARPES